MLDPFGEAYLRLVLEIDRHIPGYIDAYLGPAALKEAVAAGPLRSPDDLLNDLARLRALTPTEDRSREQYVRTTLRAIEGTLRLLQGQKPGYLEEVAQLYDIRPRPVEESVFLAAHAELDTLLPGKGTLSERIAVRRKSYELSKDKLMPAMELALNEVRRRTVPLAELVEGEDVELALVRDQPWGAYNWYLGNGRSRVEFNTDIPFFALGVLGTMAHEAYPGHHTEGQLKEARLWRGRRYAEHAAYLLHSPAAVISEGIATVALEIIFPDDSHHDWNVDVLLPAVGMRSAETAEQMKRISAALNALRYVSGNAAYLYHSSAVDRAAAIDYTQLYGLTSPERAAKSFEFFTSPLFSSYIFTYTAGYDLIMAAAGDDRVALFTRLLDEQILPSQLADGLIPERK
jgi:hypothetical protein